MARPPSIQWYYKQWLGDNKVLAMDWDARAMHFHLLMLSIQEEPPGTIPGDDAAIRRWLSLPLNSVESDQVWRRVKPQVLAAWRPEGERLVNSGMVEAVARQQRYRERYENGTKKDAKHNEDVIGNTDFDVGSLKSNTKAEILTSDDATNYVLIELGIGGRNLRQVIQEQIHRQLKKVGAATKDTAEAMVEAWHLYEKAEVEFRKGPEKFFSDGTWRKSPEEWKKRGKSQQISKAAERQQRNREVLLRTFADGLDPNAGSGSVDDRQGVHGGGKPALEGTVLKVSAAGNSGGV